MVLSSEDLKPRTQISGILHDIPENPQKVLFVPDKVNTAHSLPASVRRTCPLLCLLRLALLGVTLSRMGSTSSLPVR